MPGSGQSNVVASSSTNAGSSSNEAELNALEWAVYHAATVDPRHRASINQCLLPLSQYLGGDPYSADYSLADLERWGDAIMAAVNESVEKSSQQTVPASTEDHQVCYVAGGIHQESSRHAGWAEYYTRTGLRAAARQSTASAMAAYRRFISSTQPELSRLLGSWKSRLSQDAADERQRQLEMAEYLRYKREKAAAAAAAAAMEDEIAEQQALNAASMPEA